ncbi:hypothetical protein PJL18_03347 [Paenarthrobacter nicotinovorans]|nr:hypothetical protein [Paenarthrobacter nicotinovorans]
MSVGGVDDQEVRGRVCQGEGRQQFKASAGGKLFDPEAGDVLEAVHFEPGFAQQRTAVASRDKGKVFGDEVADAEVLLRFVDSGGVHQGAGKPDLLCFGGVVPAEDAVAGLHAAAQGQSEGGPLVLAFPCNQEEFAAVHLERGCREEIVPAAVDLELLYGQHNEAFRRTVVC